MEILFNNAMLACMGGRLYHAQAPQPLSMKDQNPRFRTAHDAGKYIAAQLYEYARGLNPEEFGAIPRYIENPEWLDATYEVVRFRADNGEEVHAVKDPKRMVDQDQSPAYLTPQQWYARSPFTIIIAADKLDYESFSEWWNFAQITSQEFADYLSGCTLID